MQTFGWNLLQFARSVDNLHQEVVDGMKGLVGEYFLRKGGLGACYFCVHRSGAKFEGKEAFNTVWSSEPSAQAHVVRRFTGGKTLESPNLRALAYNESRCLWVTGKAAPEGDPTPTLPTLDQTPASDLEDHWALHRREDLGPLPPYLSMHDKPCRTLVALPLAHLGLQLGVLVVEFDRRIPCTPGARIEAELIREALGRILWLQDAAMAQQEGTRKAFEELRKVVVESSSSVDPPTVFFAGPSQSDSEVIAAIKTVVTRDYRDRLRMIPWDDMANPGQITDQIVEEISRCRYGICYLSEIDGVTESEPGKRSKRRYRDNRNVLIEAGMLYALRNSPVSATQAWIPVREPDDFTDDVPFDFVAERMIQVPRTKSGKLLQDELEAVLRSRIDAMLAI